MTKITHPDFIDKLKQTEVLDLLYNVVEAKTGKHVDILHQVPVDLIADAEEAIGKLINFSSTLDYNHRA